MKEGEERERAGLELQMLLKALVKENNIYYKNHAYTFYTQIIDIGEYKIISVPLQSVGLHCLMQKGLFL